MRERVIFSKKDHHEGECPSGQYLEWDGISYTVISPEHGNHHDTVRESL